jgi:hypothetical protein
MGPVAAVAKARSPSLVQLAMTHLIALSACALTARLVVVALKAATMGPFATLVCAPMDNPVLQRAALTVLCALTACVLTGLCAVVFPQ